MRGRLPCAAARVFLGSSTERTRYRYRPRAQSTKSSLPKLLKISQQNVALPTAGPVRTSFALNHKYGGGRRTYAPARAYMGLPSQRRLLARSGRGSGGPRAHCRGRRRRCGAAPSRRTRLAASVPLQRALAVQAPHAVTVLVRAFRADGAWVGTEVLRGQTTVRLVRGRVRGGPHWRPT